jgi:GAF domain-containing protein
MSYYSEGVVDEEQRDALQSVAEEIGRTMNMPTSVWVLDEQGQRLRIAASVGLPSSYVRDAYLDLDEVSVMGETFKTGQFTVVEEITSDPRWKHKDEAREMGWKSVLCVPIKAQGTVSGVIAILTFVMREFSDMEIQRLTQYATQISLTAEADTRRETLSRLLEATRGMRPLTTGHPQAVLQHIVDRACDLVGANCAIIFPYDAIREEFLDIDGAVHHGLQHPLTPDDRPQEQGFGAEVVRQGETIHAEIDEHDPAVPQSPFIARERLKALMGVTLEAADRGLGLLYIGFRTPHQFSAEEQDTIRLFAQQAAMAIDYSGLHEQAAVRTEALKRLHNLSFALTSMAGSPESVEAVLTQFAEAGLSSLGADLITVYRYVENRDEYILPPVEVGERKDLSVRKSRVYEDDVLRDIVRKRRAQYSPDAQQEPILTQPYTVTRHDAPSARFVYREDIRSVAVLPLFVRTRIVGVLFVNYRTPQAFAQQQRELIELFASQAAIAIHNGRRFEDVTALRDITRDTTRIDDKDKVLQRVLEGSLELVGGDAGAILLRGDGANELQRRYAVGKDAGGTVPFGHGLIGAAAETRRPVRVGDVAADPRYAEDANGTASELDVPMLFGDELLGVLNLECARFDAFDESDEELASVLASQAAAALHNADQLVRTQNELDQRIDDISAFQQVHESIHRAGLQKAMLLVTEKAVELTGAEGGALRLLDSTDTQLEIGALVGEPGPVQESATIPVDEHSLDGWVALTGQSYLCQDASQDEHCKQWQADAQSLLTAPIYDKRRFLGTLGVKASASEDGFSEDDQRLLEAVAGQAAVVIQNARDLQSMELDAAIGRSWAPQDSAAVPTWYRKLVELRAVSDRTGATAQVALLLRDGRRLEGEWESFTRLSGRQALFEMAIRRVAEGEVIWVTTDSILEMDATADGKKVKLIFGQPLFEEDDHRDEGASPSLHLDE